MTASSLYYVIGILRSNFLLHNKRSAKEAHLAEMKLAASDTARARKSPAGGLFALILKSISWAVLFLSFLLSNRRTGKIPSPSFQWA